MKRPLPIGVEFYKEMIKKNYYYVDKTLLIKDILDKGAAVCLFTRPRRFGKTLALTMLRAYFEDERDRQGGKIDNCHYFDGTKIAACGERYRSKMGTCPVINLSLKSAKQPTFEMAYEVLIRNIGDEFDRHGYLLQGGARTDEEKETFGKIRDKKAAAADYATALAFLSKCLKKYHGRKVIILIDEYDVPLENADLKKFYEKMADFIRSFFESALKTNDNLEFAVITGCLRISKESIFTGLNNFAVISVLNEEYAEHFGFTQEEVCEMLSCYGLEEKQQELERWYNGYLFGQTEIYNPWSVINYVNAANVNPDTFPKPYWPNTSSNSIVRELIEEADFGTRSEIESLIAGGTIEKVVHEDITYEDIHASRDNLWNFLFFTGYLKKVGERLDGRAMYLKMAIPNEEIGGIYERTVIAWFDKKVENSDRAALLCAVENGDCRVFEDFLSDQLQDAISFYDYAESYYHGFLAGLLKGLGRYRMLSSRESGNGRPDIIMKAASVRGKAFIMELKAAKDFCQMEAECEKALAQAKERNYRAGLEQEGYSDITVYGICFYRKDCMVRKLDMGRTEERRKE